jgi:hypothetical protein
MSSETITSPRAPEGWQLVPVDSTVDMFCAGDESIIKALYDRSVVVRDPTPAQCCYTAMLAAAPAPPPEADRIAALDASWRATLARERAVHLNEVRLKDEYRTRTLAAEAELAKLRGATG